MGEFFGETEDPDAAQSRELVKEFSGLSSEAQREVRDFVRFKKLQEQAAPETAVAGTASEPEEKP